jgi:hypothetical protein
VKKPKPKPRYMNQPVSSNYRNELVTQPWVAGPGTEFSIPG